MKTKLDFTRSIATIGVSLTCLSPSCLIAQSSMEHQIEIGSAELWVNKRQDSILNMLTDTYTLHYNLEIEFQNFSEPSSSCVLDFKGSGPSAPERQLGLWPAGQSSPTFVIPGQTRFGMQFETNAIDQEDYRLSNASVRLSCLSPKPRITGWRSVDLSRTVWDNNSIGQFDTRTPQ